MKLFRLFSNCRLVKGANRSSICDLQKRQLYLIPNNIAKYLEKDLRENKVNENDKLKAWIEELVSCGLGFWTDMPDYFPSLSLDWDSPDIINNAVIEADSYTADDFKNIVNQLDALFCKFIEIRFYKVTDFENLISAIEVFGKGYIRGITVFAPFSNYCFDISNKLLRASGLIRQIVLHSCSNDQVEQHQDENRQLHLTTQIIDSHAHCGNISQDYFSINLSTFAESQCYNTCLNKKISIGVNGDIKNCPSMNKVYANVKNEKIKKVVSSEEFQNLWNVKKDDIKICQDCEFRYVCTDCRAFTEDPDDVYSKPLKCGYNPYTTQWEDWSISPQKQNAIQFYKLY